MAYTKTTWVNNSTPAINAENLNNIENGIEAIETNLGGTILWTNSSPNSTFAEQSITLSSGDCDLLMWIFKRSNTSNYLASPVYTIANYGGMAIVIGSDGNIKRRVFSYVDSTHYNILDATSSVQDTDNTALIPLYVVGYKTGLF